MCFVLFAWTIQKALPPFFRITAHGLVLGRTFSNKHIDLKSLF